MAVEEGEGVLIAATSEEIEKFESLTEFKDLRNLQELRSFKEGSLSDLRESKDFRELSELIEAHGFKETKEYDEHGNLKSVTFTNLKNAGMHSDEEEDDFPEEFRARSRRWRDRIRDRRKKAITRSSSPSSLSPSSSPSSSMLENSATGENGLRLDQTIESPEEPMRLKQQGTEMLSGRVAAVAVEVDTNGDCLMSSEDPIPHDLKKVDDIDSKLERTEKKLQRRARSEQNITGAETEVGKAIEVANEGLLDRARRQLLNCDDVARHTAFLAEQRQNLKEQMESLQKKLRIHHSLIKANGRNISKHLTAISNLEKLISATKRDSIRFNLILNQFLSSPAYATMLHSFERVAKNSPKADEDGAAYTFNDVFSNGLDSMAMSFEDVLEEEKRNISMHKNKQSLAS